MNEVFTQLVDSLSAYLANLDPSVVAATSTRNASAVATAVRIAVLVLTGFIALRQMGIASDIIHMAFGLTLGAAAVASAIAFGIGGREVAARQFAQWTRGSEAQGQA